MRSRQIHVVVLNPSLSPKFFVRQPYTDKVFVRVRAVSLNYRDLLVSEGTMLPDVP